MTAAEANAAILAGARVAMTVEPGHVMHVWAEDKMVYHECVQGWSAGVLEPVCALDSDYLRTYLTGRHAFALAQPSDLTAGGL